VSHAITSSRRRALWHALIRWVDTSAGSADAPSEDRGHTDWVRVAPFVAMHLACMGTILTGWSFTAVSAAAVLYVTRIFAITAFYHRYFSHRAFRTYRGVQLAFAILGNSSSQRGPLWWAAHHRHHHRRSDRSDDVHSPQQHGFLWSHIGWITSRSNFPTDLKIVPDLARYAELRFLDRFDTLVPTLLAVGLFGLGASLERLAPALGTTGPQMVMWGFFVSTIMVFHATCLINSLAHLVGQKRFVTDDASGNSFLLALVTLGEGWHNNHHHYPISARQGWWWWEIDFTYYGLKALESVGLIWDLEPVPERIRTSRRIDRSPTISA